MICDSCGKGEATVHLTELVNGKIVEMHLCEACAQEKAVQMQIPFGLPIFLGSIAPQAAQDSHSGGLVCDQCHLTYEEFKKSGRLGCAACYDTFAKELEPLLKNIHGANKHSGKIPKAVMPEVKAQMQLDSLKEELKRAVENEEFELAAQIRDKIKEIEGQVNG